MNVGNTCMFIYHLNWHRDIHLLHHGQKSVSSSMLLGDRAKGRKRKSPELSSVDKLREKVTYLNVMGVLSG